MPTAPTPLATLIFGGMIALAATPPGSAQETTATIPQVDLSEVAKDSAPPVQPALGGDAAPGHELAPPPLMPDMDPGQSDLSEATIAKVEANTPADYEAVATLIQSALTKGLNDENTAFAKKMLADVQLTRGQAMAGLMLRTQGRRQMMLRDQAVETLREAVQNDPSLAEAHLLIARLALLPGGDPELVLEAATDAIKLLGDDPERASAAYLMRAGARETLEQKEEELNQALDLDADNLDALRLRAALYLEMKNVDLAVEDLKKIFEIDPSNIQVASAAVEKLVELERADEAATLLSDAITASPSEGLYRLRALLYRMLDREDDALEDLNKAIAMQPQDPVALLQRAEIALGRDDINAAKRDYKAAVAAAPAVEQISQGVIVRCFIAVAEGRMADAISDMRTLVALEPEEPMRKIQLASFLLQDDRPRQAIDTLTEVIATDPTNASALRNRADAKLSVGEHASAIEDYEAAIRAIETDAAATDGELAGALNNLAWVLATSPVDAIRNAPRSLELSARANQLTGETEAHILSTVAAGYAESGDFEKARQFSRLAIEAGQLEENPQLEQLKGELESYEKNEPWREKQDVPENKMPIISPENLIDT